MSATSTNINNIVLNLYTRTAHPNVRLLFTHGGRLSVQEAIWHGVPMLGAHQTHEQRQLLQRAQLADAAEFVRLSEDGVEQIAGVIRQMLDGDRYADSARRFRTAVFGASPTEPLDSATHAIEYVLRVGNARHLQLRNEHLYVHQAYLLDVGLIAAVLVIGFALIIVRNCCCRRRRDPSHDADIKTKKE